SPAAVPTSSTPANANTTPCTSTSAGIKGIWRTLQRPDGTEQHTMAMITVNGDEHPIMKHMHRPGDEKRSVVILRPDDWEEWLTTSNVEAARAMLQLYPADDMVTEAM
ncbi:SOS response-associated peptidase family protein, partial [Burkholderia cenocepacia]|uniref:SOS response-associated peptidase family protein n=1 Tax=Burkholderia cenocepacia TaxID=95486 RepID=UPI00223068B8